MAIAKMLRMKLVGINSEQERLLNALHKTGAVELKSTEVFPEGERVVSDKNELLNKQDMVENALSLITNFAKEDKKTEKPVADGFGVSYSDFVAVHEREAEILSKAEVVKNHYDLIVKNKAEIIALKSEIESFKPYEGLKERFSSFVPTTKTGVRLGIIPNNSLDKFLTSINNVDFVHAEVLASSEKGSVVFLIALKESLQEADKVLGENAFTKCTFTEDITAREKIEILENKVRDKERENVELKGKILEFVPEVYNFKLLSDYISFEKEKAVSSDNFARTAHTFTMEAYVPLERKEQVESAVNEATGSVYVEFDELTENDYAPTLMKNKKVASNFEFVTNMYSAPKYLSFDPNTVLAFFFSIFLGFITADAGYGLIMAVGGFIFAGVSKRKTGITKLANVIAWGGLATIVFGVLFDSFFGLPLLSGVLHWIDKPIMPDPVEDSLTMAGISIPTLLMMCLGMGVIHIQTGLLINAIISFRHKKIFDGICDGFTWIVFLAGLMLLVLSETGILPGFTMASVIMMIASVVFGACTAGRHEKGLGHFTKGFGAVYGLINYMSDILSYARLYGLMLSGAKIAWIVSDLAINSLYASIGGVGGIIAAGFVMILGHAFNLAMGVLGAYIHDARLQYVEFFSHFYEGEGELFQPLGTKFDHIYLTE